MQVDVEVEGRVLGARVLGDVALAVARDFEGAALEGVDARLGALELVGLLGELGAVTLGGPLDQADGDAVLLGGDFEAPFPVGQEDDGLGVGDGGLGRRVWSVFWVGFIQGVSWGFFTAGASCPRPGMPAILSDQSEPTLVVMFARRQSRSLGMWAMKRGGWDNYFEKVRRILPTSGLPSDASRCSGNRVQRFFSMSRGSQGSKMTSAGAHGHRGSAAPLSGEIRGPAVDTHIIPWNQPGAGHWRSSRAPKITERTGGWIM